MVGRFTRCSTPLRWLAFCEVCRRVVRPPYYFSAPLVLNRGRARYRCARPDCVHTWQAERAAAPTINDPLPSA